MRAHLRGPLSTQTLAGRLTRSLILWVGGVWLLCVLGVVWYTDREISYNFDNELVEVSHRFFDIALDHLDAAGPRDAAEGPLVLPSPGSFADADLLYQIVAPDTRVLARSAEAQPEQFDVPLAPGFENTHGWRVYTLSHPTRPLFMQVADPLHERREAVNRTLVGLGIVMVAMLPLLALLLRRIARRELQVLDALTHEISLRDGQQLTPIALPGLPRELRSVEDHVNRLLDRLSRALDVERALAANAAHELRTPLTAARLRLQTALEHGLHRDDVQAAIAALQTLSRRTEKLLQLSRAESSAPYTREPVDLAHLATTVAQEFWQDDRAADRLDLVTAYEGPAPVARGDFDALAIALRNLLENALSYAGDSAVELIVGPGCAIAVRDHGPGVSSDRLQTLQQRHVRQSADRTGYGLGLSIVATIAAKHDAQLQLTSPLAGETGGFEARLLLTPR
ncbi:two-component sensor histidine kinase [Diaphorobacter nitroreducens]|uniref:sensor histidine kinase n=1 Tax=Diaphorobacter nitroreducens TaxID=164759 RepID=UPI000B59CDCD|nr:HAMP domain-containing sensor histidine kinase [Diaphorobacter nitroreducens]ASI68052.1 two-component sensor histidine kinase [Diaphorobacter nitroreducens]